jgi:hypothetical protein
MDRDFEFDVYFPDGRRERHVAVMSAQPSLTELKSVVMPFLSGARELEHLPVLRPPWEKSGAAEEIADMFVDELGSLKLLDRNDHATEFYRQAWLREAPFDDPETLPWIAGIAVVFKDKVWREWPFSRREAAN